MKLKWLVAALAALAVAGMGAPAFATTWVVDCSAGTITNNGSGVASGLSASVALGEVLGTPSGPATTFAAASGDTVEINGICTQDITVRTSGLLIEDKTNGVGSVNVGTAIEGQLEFNGAVRETVGGIEIGSHSGSFSFAGGESANLYIDGDASVLVENCDVENGALDGILVSAASSAKLLNVLVSGNGASHVLHQDDGIRVTGASSVTLGNNNGTEGVIVAGSGGPGISVVGSAINIFSVVVDNNGTYQLLLIDASSGTITNATICAGTGPDQSLACTPGSGTYPAAALIGASSAQFDNSEGANAITGSAAAQALLVAGGSTGLLQGSTFSAAGTSTPVAEASSAAAIDLAGGNTITATGSNGVALQADHLGSLMQVSASLFGYTQASDTVNGGGAINEQSNGDFGIGTVGGSGCSAQTMCWTTGGAGIVVQQNSSFRLSGGATISGNLLLQQGSNGFFNTKFSGGNNVTSVTCPFNLVAASHVSGAGSVTPAVSVSTGFSATTPPTCMTF